MISSMTEEYLGPIRGTFSRNENSIICRGEEPTGHWAHHPRPDGELIPVKDGSGDPTSVSMEQRDGGNGVRR